MGGQPDPIHKAQALDIEQKMGMMKMQQGQEELGIKKEEAKRKRVNDILDFVTKFDVPEEVATQMIRAVIKHDPAARDYYDADANSPFQTFPRSASRTYPPLPFSSSGAM